jgi:RNA polymerase sigma-70 factor (ECF subfamily)
MKINFVSEFSDEQIINGCIIGDRKMQQLLYQRYSRQMFAVCLRYAKDHQAAEDILQDGFVKIFRNIGSFRKQGSFEGWVRRIFINTSIEYLRRSVNLYSIVNDEGEAIDIKDETTYDGLHVDELLEMIQSLSTGYRTIFNLYAIEGYSHKEIAEMLKISEGTSKSQLARARQILMDKVYASQKVAGKIQSAS